VPLNPGKKLCESWLYHSEENPVISKALFGTLPFFIFLSIKISQNVQETRKAYYVDLNLQPPTVLFPVLETEVMLTLNKTKRLSAHGRFLVRHTNDLGTSNRGKSAGKI
ncbi:hypothetical protein C0J52_18465, partial [Blattella germanica]